MSKRKNKYYVVWVGVNPGIYTSWADCEAQIKGFPNAKYKAFKSASQAEAAFKDSSTNYIGKEITKNKASLLTNADINMRSIAVDAACRGNPGDLEYRGVVTKTGQEIFKVGPFKHGTNNIGEFLAIVHGLAFLQKSGKDEIIIYTDSKTAMAWVRNKKLKTTLESTAVNQKLFQTVDRALNWLKENEFRVPIIKWKTKEWGEIPADFGRK